MHFHGFSCFRHNSTDITRGASSLNMLCLDVVPNISFICTFIMAVHTIPCACRWIPTHFTWDQVVQNWKGQNIFIEFSLSDLCALGWSAYSGRLWKIELGHRCHKNKSNQSVWLQCGWPGYSYRRSWSCNLYSGRSLDRRKSSCFEDSTFSAFLLQLQHNCKKYKKKRFCFYVDWSLKVLFSNYWKTIILKAFSTIERLMIPWFVHPISLSGWANFSTNVTWHSSVANVLWLNMVWNCWSLVCIKTACIALIDLGPSSAYLGVNQGIKLPKST